MRLESGATLDVRTELERDGISLVSPEPNLLLSAQDASSLAEALTLALEWHDSQRIMGKWFSDRYTQAWRRKPRSPPAN